MRLIFKRDYFYEPSDNYTMGRAQAKKIFLGSRRTFVCECGRFLIGGCELDPRPKAVVHNKNGSYTIGCSLLRATQVKKIIGWLKNGKA